MKKRNLNKINVNKEFNRILFEFIQFQIIIFLTILLKLKFLTENPGKIEKCDLPIEYDECHTFPIF